MKILLLMFGVVIVLTAISGLWFYRTILLQKKQIQTGAESFNTISTSPLPSGATPNPDNFDAGSYTFKNQTVGRINGLYDGITAGILRFTSSDGKLQFATINNSTKVVCQPTGYLLNNQSDTPASQIYIEDRTGGNSGIPWGVQISNSDIAQKAIVGSDIDVYYSLGGGLVNSLTAAYVWIKDCQK